MAKLSIITVIAKTASLWCAGLNFTQDPAVLTVLGAGEKSKKPSEITPEQLSKLQASQFLNVIEGEGTKAGPDLSVELSASREALSDMAAERNKALEQLEAVTAQLTETAGKLAALELAQAKK